MSEYAENTSDEWKDKLKRFGDYTFGGGWWTGGKTMTANKSFPNAVREKIPEEDKPILVVRIAPSYVWFSSFIT